MDLVPIGGDQHRNVDHQSRPVPARAIGPFLQGGHGDLLHIGRRAVPAHGAVGKSSRSPESGSAQRGDRHRGAGRMWEAGVRSIELALEMHGTGLQHGLHDAEILDQTTQGTVEIDVVDVDHRPRVSAADAEVEAAGGKPFQRERLGDEAQRVPGEGRDDGGAKGDALRLHGGRAEQRERVERGGGHHHPGVGDIRPLGADAQIDDRFGAARKDGDADPISIARHAVSTSRSGYGPSAIGCILVLAVLAVYRPSSR